MDDPWGSDAWSTPSTDNQDSLKQPATTKWNTFQRDADEETADVAAPTWTESIDPIWDEGNLWHTSSSTLNTFKPSIQPNLLNDVQEQASEVQQEAASVTGVAAEEDQTARVSTPKAILPTPPLSPLPIPLAGSSSPSVEDLTLADEGSSNPSVEDLTLAEERSASPDPFGSFESAESAQDEKPNDAWSPTRATALQPDVTEPWGNAWGVEVEDKEATAEVLDEWEVAQQAKLRRERKVPPELLDGLLSQWENLATEIYGEHQSRAEDTFSWRRGLDNVESLAEFMENFLPPPSLPPPLPLSKTQISKSIKNALRLTRSLAITQSSPMSRLYASKGSIEWERAVHSQQASAQDNWGWDLKYELEDDQAKDVEKDRKATGFLSFWGKKTSSSGSGPSPTSEVKHTLAINNVKQPVLVGTSMPTAKTSSPLASSRPSIDMTSRASFDLPVQREVAASVPISNMSTSSLSTSNAEEKATTTLVETPSPTPSGLSRFWSKLSKRSSTPVSTSMSSDKEKEGGSSLQQVPLSADDLSFLSDIVPLSKPSAVVDPIDALLSHPSRQTSTKLPPALAPPPPPPSISFPSFRSSPGNHRPADSLDAQIMDAQFMDLLDNAGLGPSDRKEGYIPVLLDPLEDAPKTSGEPLPTLLSASPSPPFGFQLSSNPTQSPATVVNKTLKPSGSGLSPPPLPSLGKNPVGKSINNVFSGEVSKLAPFLATESSVTRSDLLPAIPNQAFQNTNFFSDFVSGPSKFPSAETSIPPGSNMPPKSSVSTNTIPTTAPLKPGQSEDFGEFGEFISTPPLSTEPAKFTNNVDLSFSPPMSARSSGTAARWPDRISPSSLPPRIAPPPIAAKQQTTANLLDGDFSTVDQLIMASNTKPSPSLSPPPRSHSSTPLKSLGPAAVLSGKSTGQSGLSAQDLSFFENL